MEILELEQKYVELQSFLNEPSSKRTRLIRISELFDQALSSSNLSLIEVYTSEFLPKYFTLIKSIKIRGLKPDVLVKLQVQLTKLNKFDFLQNYGQEIEESLVILKNKYELFSAWLNGNLTLPANTLIYFPVLEKSDSNKVPGFLEIIKVGISDGESKFIIEPAESEEDVQLEKQLHLCWELAVDYCKKYIKKIKPNHTVDLKFENKLAVYIGNSLGIALTLAFIEALLKHYNSSIIVNVNGCIAVTGGIDKNSNIISTGKTIIETKVETVFYSDAHIFCVPKTDAIWAEDKLLELKKEYPNRELKIVGLTDLYDLLDRRQIVDVRKQKLIVRTGKFVKKNWISSIATVLLAILFSYLFVMDWDENPAILTTDGTTLFVKNKNGKILWTKFVDIVKTDINSENPYSQDARIVDINGDGTNEILLTREIDKKIQSVKDYSLLSCYDKNGEVIWKYSFKDNVSSKREVLDNDYSIYIIDTLSVGGLKSLFLRSSNINSFTSAIFKIDLQTSIRLPGTFWCSGHIADVVLKDMDSDGKAEILGLGYDNGYEDAVFFVFEIDTLTVGRPTTKEYLLNDLSSSEMKAYIRLPKTDYEKYANVRTPTLTSGTFRDDFKNQKYKFAIFNPFNRQNELFGYEINYNLKDIDITITSGFRVARDSLVAHEKLNPPFTDTEEYKNVIKNNILYWVNGLWVTRNELIKYE